MAIGRNVHHYRLILVSPSHLYLSPPAAIPSLDWEFANFLVRSLFINFHPDFNSFEHIEEALGSDVNVFRLIACWLSKKNIIERNPKASDSISEGITPIFLYSGLHDGLVDQLSIFISP